MTQIMIRPLMQVSDTLSFHKAQFRGISQRPRNHMYKSQLRMKLCRQRSPGIRCPFGSFATIARHHNSPEGHISLLSKDNKIILSYYIGPSSPFIEIYIDNPPNCGPSGAERISVDVKARPWCTMPLEIAVAF